MKAIFTSLLFFATLCSLQVVYGQNSPINRIKFFGDTSIVNATITTNMTQLFRQKNKPGVKFPANFSATLPGGVVVNEPVLLQVRGHFRKDNCYVPPLWLIFKDKKDSTALMHLGSLKLVSECKTSSTDEQYVLKEFLIYKMYNLITNMSFRARLMNINLADSGGKKKTISEHAFLMEDIKDVAKRNNCKAWKKGRIGAQQTDQQQMATMAVFEYMIGNTDWGVYSGHNVRLILSKADSFQRPYVVPYDFDFSGFVNTDYAVPDDRLDIQNVQQRLYRGFPISMDLLEKVLDVFKKQKDSIYALINNFDLLTSKTKKNLTGYLNDFFKDINDPKTVQYIFIDNARKE